MLSESGESEEKKLLKEFERLKVILRLEGFNLEEMQHEYETIPF